MKHNMIRLENVTKEYFKPTQKIIAVSSLDLLIPRGEFLGIMGMSGSGKTTLINLIAGFDKPSSGKVVVDGLDLSELTDKQVSEFRNTKIGMIFQHFNLIKEFTALQNVIVPFIIANKKYSTAVERAIKLLSEQGLGHRLHHYPAELSGGEQQRVAIARALMNDPEIILADEPSGNLDRESAENIAKIFENIHSNGKTLVVISHDTKLLKNATKIVIMEYGNLKNSNTNGCQLYSVDIT
ncbi:ABC transporter ATP-binding protein [Methanosarcina sp.]|jgi:ABC-type lipoprotein export system ATPase subunit|uniref:ABC transporter ATP-binding protein n=1 Tax=Methanosarcina sp. TaxID=2213 RepID=UPI002CE1F29B|nr:ABC transporter ATP-binding protein [Methanosarcina sp.]HOW14681.1 ABC transporter ATP-binding protein [Methanosarcina sp.]